MGGRRSPRYNCSFYICPVYRKRISKEYLAVPQVNGLYGGQSCILAQLVGQSECFFSGEREEEKKKGKGAGCHRRYIKNFAKRALPLTDLLRKGTPFEWTSESQEAFDDIKKAILNPPVLALPDPNAELQITTDASSRGIGAVLEQKYPNSEIKPLYFFQRN
ncbi:transposon Tf2-9 polyprotein [Trichonephila clavipes]|nr:transposon Tf2-9 polyprotein [Trichonephila clavipes]